MNFRCTKGRIGRGMYLHGRKFSGHTTETSRILYEFSNESVERSVSELEKQTPLKSLVTRLFVRHIVLLSLHRALYSHFTGPLGAASCDQPAKPFMAEVVGAAYEHEITLMNSLTVNLHLMMQVFNTRCYNR